MATKTAAIKIEGDGLRLSATSGSGHTIVLDNTTGNTGMRPAELVPIAVAGCTAMDVITILRKKRQVVDHYEIRAAGEQMDGHPNAFTRFDVVHVFEGRAIDPEAVRRAIELSATRYCPVGATLASGMSAIHHAYVIRDEQGEGPATEVLVTGPHLEPAVAGAPAAR